MEGLSTIAVDEKNERNKNACASTTFTRLTPGLCFIFAKNAIRSHRCNNAMRLYRKHLKELKEKFIRKHGAKEKTVKTKHKKIKNRSKTCPKTETIE